MPFPSPMHESESEVAQSCPTPSHPMDCSLPGSSIHGICQARVLEWGAIFLPTPVFFGSPCGSSGKESACNAGDLGSILGWENPLEECMVTHSSILAWKLSWTEEPGRLQSTGLQRVGHDCVCTHTHTHIYLLSIYHLFVFLSVYYQVS